MMKNRRFCPNCGSTNVEPDTRHTNQLGEAIFNQNKWLCNDCDYTGVMPHLSEKDCSEQQPEGLLRPEGEPGDFDQEFSENVDFEPEEQEKLDTDAGRAYWKYFIYITLPTLLVYALYVVLLK